jgi:hypothetical protein
MAGDVTEHHLGTSLKCRVALSCVCSHSHVAVKAVVDTEHPAIMSPVTPLDIVTSAVNAGGLMMCGL